MNIVQSKLNKTIAIIDDTDIWLKTVKIWLIHYGFKDIICFDSAKGFYDYFQDHNQEIDIFIVDHFLEDYMLGTDVIRLVRNKHPESLIISTSADFLNDKYAVDTKSMKCALNAGANRAIFKDISSLRDVLKYHLLVREKEHDFVK
jgi:DNA-binding response OmpR family regulator